MTRDEQLIRAALEMAASRVNAPKVLTEGDAHRGEMLIALDRAIRAITPAEVLATVAWRGPGEIAHRYSPDWMAQGDCQICGHTREAHQPAPNAVAKVGADPAPDAVARLVEADDLCVVWSHEHGAWWRPKSAGYCYDVRGAGVYSRDEAISISHTFRDHWREGTKPDELAVRVIDLPGWAQSALAAMEADHDHT